MPVGLLQVEVDIAVADMAERRPRGCPASAPAQAAVARRISSGTWETGTETSFLTLAPSRFCASECSSRSRQSAGALRLAFGDHGVVQHGPSSSAASSTASSVARRPASGRGVASSISA